ncbi:mandelate racemase/muconate lactonizing enzyme family protein [Microbacterium sp. H37-C3]|uniref:mandelate racemase/muconate lactonizing enzyme family protein n=1 Tax=Microbacterium sp. H37-C3 TaxID=3004354 RepID=UPI0022AEB682|nr:mandelate racemase/muconate lactonizing enzyme family protein [Microbacterium sp. H37-C3]MCZ4068876.1 mandelate racemase/muconate lactonizing enzyme family protein [Microbacterium sp. H37-C3]
MAIIERVRTDLYRVPLANHLTDSTHGVMMDFELITVRIDDSDGATGVGYTYTVNHGGAAVATMIEKDLSTCLIGKDADQIERLWQDMWWCLHYAGRGGHQTSAISAVDIALWDLIGVKTRMPLWKLFGGYDPRVPVYAGGIDLEFPLTRLLEQADGFRAQGFRAIKMKVGRADLREDVARVAAMREHLGEGFPLMVDANMKWNVDEALRASRAFLPFDLTWIEEPTIPDDLAGNARIVAHGQHAIAAGENLHTIYDFAQAIERSALTLPEPDVSNIGGYTGFRKVAALAEAHNLSLTSHGVHDLTIHSLAAAPHRTFMEAHGFGLDEFIAQPMQITDGFATAPDRPGHGVELDFTGLTALDAA